MRRMGGCIVVMELPSFFCPQVRSFAPHSITKATKYPLVVLFDDGLPLWCVFVMHHPTGVEKSQQPWRCCGPAVLSLASGMIDISIVRAAPLFLGCTRKPTTHHQWSWCSGSWNHILRGPACLVRFAGEAASAPSLAASARISRTLSSSPNPQSKWYAPIQCLPPPRLPVLGQWYDGPAWAKSALGWWHCHFG